MTRLRLFVYGTLQPVAQTPMGRWIGQRCVSSAAASAAGRIFAIRDGDGWFPALVPARCSRRVSGTLCVLDLKPGELALLDRYEGAEYRRISVPVRVNGHAAAPAQLYLWRIPLPGDTRPIRSGDFLCWLRDNRLSAFSASRNGA